MTHHLVSSFHLLCYSSWTFVSSLPLGGPSCFRCRWKSPRARRHLGVRPNTAAEVRTTPQSFSSSLFWFSFSARLRKVCCWYWRHYIRRISYATTKNLSTSVTRLAYFWWSSIPPSTSLSTSSLVKDSDENYNAYCLISVQLYLKITWPVYSWHF